MPKDSELWRLICVSLVNERIADRFETYQVIAREIQPSEVRKVLEEVAIGREAALEPAAAEVKLYYLTCLFVTRNPIPQAAAVTLLPRLHLRIRRDSNAGSKFISVV